MGLIYGNLFLEQSNEEILNEGLFLTKEGRSLKKDIKEYLKSMKISAGFGEKIIKNLKTSYDIQLQKKIDNGIHKKFNPSFGTDVIEVMHTTYVNGVPIISYTYEQNFTGYKNNSVYHFTLLYTNYGASIKSFREIKISELNLPEDLVKFIISNADKGYELIILKNGYKSLKVGGMTRRSMNSGLLDKVSRYVNSRYKNYEIGYNGISGTVKIKEKKSE